MVVVGISLAYLLGYGAAAYIAPTPPASAFPGAPFEVFWEAWEVVQEKYYDRSALNPQALTYGALQGALESLGDPNTGFVTPQYRAILDEDLEGVFEGIGAVVDLNQDGYLLIIEPLAGRPADRAGLRRGDVVLRVDGRDTRGLSLLEMIGLVRGPEGTTVTLSVQREGRAQPFDLTIVRGRIQIRTVETAMLAEGIAYLKLNEFNAHSARDLRDALEDLLAAAPVGLILDLRDNPGGLLDQAVVVGSQFLAQGPLLYERSAHREEKVHEATGGGAALEIPLVVLVNAGTASAAEIVAGAIQDYGRGVLIGERTFGKGSVQAQYDLSDGAGLRLTVARWYTPRGRLIEDRGLTPDIEVPVSNHPPQADDPQLDRAIQVLLEQVGAREALIILSRASLAGHL
ncbi:MAG: S41 family peptidase [Chloroflexi bacterium]|nr:S41 family peptidase [Chloroflexota bacterium]